MSPNLGPILVPKCSKFKINSRIFGNCILENNPRMMLMKYQISRVSCLKSQESHEILGNLSRNVSLLLKISSNFNKNNKNHIKFNECLAFYGCDVKKCHEILGCCCCFSISKLIRVMGLVSASSSHYRGIKKAKLINIDPKKQLSSPY